MADNAAVQYHFFAEDFLVHSSIFFVVVESTLLDKLAGT
jgi:hypothetical protein